MIGLGMGTLFVVATPIGNLGDMTARAVETLRSVSLIAAEDTRHSATLMQAFEISTPMISYHRHSGEAKSQRLLDALDRGDVAIVSDAGAPAIADPGHDLVAAAVAAGYRVVPIPGASAVIAAVSASGLVPGPFLFLGFLPRSGEDRRRALGKAIAAGYPFVLFESPLRTWGTLTDVNAAAPGRSGIVAREITKLHEEFRRGLISDLADLYGATPPRGEVVLIVGGPDGTSSEDADFDIEALANSILSQGVKPSKAARELSSITGLPAADAYELIQRLGRSNRNC